MANGKLIAPRGRQLRGLVGEEGILSDLIDLLGLEEVDPSDLATPLGMATVPMKGVARRLFRPVPRASQLSEDVLLMQRLRGFPSVSTPDVDRAERFLRKFGFENAANVLEKEFKFRTLPSELRPKTTPGEMFVGGQMVRKQSKTIVDELIDLLTR